MQLLFYSRLALYYLAVSLPAFYPGVAVPYDFIGIVCWFGLIPAMMFLAFYLRPPRRGFIIGFFLAFALLVVILVMVGPNRDGFFFLGAATAAYFLTFMIFGAGSRGTSFAVLETFVPAVVYYRLLNFARASEDAARLSSDWLIPILITAIAVFLLHGLLIYLAAFPDRSAGRKRKELALFLGMMVPLAVVLMLFIPRDFIKHDIVLNDLFSEPKPQRVPPGSDFDPDDKGGGKSKGRNENPGGQGGAGDKKGKEFGGSDGPDGPIRKVLPDEHRSSPGRARGENPGQGNKPDGREKKGKGGAKNKPGNPSGKKEKKGKQGNQSKPKNEKNKGGKNKSGGQGKSQEKKGQGNRPGTPQPDDGREKKNKGNQKGKQKGNQKNKDEKGNSGKQKENKGGSQGQQQQENQKQQQQKQKDRKQQKQKQQKQKQRKKKQKTEPDLKTVPSDRWNNRSGGSGSSGNSKGESRQDAVMIIASPVPSVYAADSYWNDFDPVKGFRISVDEPYNHLRRSRFLNTWRNTRKVKELKRKPVKIFYFSTLEDRLTAYEPWSVEPTRIDVRYQPFKLSYFAESMMSFSKKEDWQKARVLRPDEKVRFEKFLKTGLKGKYKRTFARHLKTALVDWKVEKKKRAARAARKRAALEKKKNKKLRKRNRRRPSPKSTPEPGKSAVQPGSEPAKASERRGEYYDRIQAIMHGLRGFQYRIGFDEDTSLKKMHKFLTVTKTGDCTELSHTAAILGRMAGVPSRIVTGYVAADWTQKKAHRRGVARLRKQIKPLQKFPLKNLYLVTTAHRHAWVQFYLPEYGWLNFESTSHAKPPKPGSYDRNNDDVVIPDIKEAPNVAKEKAKREFNWKGAGLILLLVVGLFFLGLYIFRFAREFVLYRRSRGDGLPALEALYRLLLMRLAAIGYPLKGGHETALEYAGRVGDTKPVASRYTMLRYRENYAEGEEANLRVGLRKDAKEAISGARERKGFLGFLGRLFSLRGLNY